MHSSWISRCQIQCLCEDVSVFVNSKSRLRFAKPTHVACAKLPFLTACSLPELQRPGEPSAHCADMSAPLVTAEAAQPDTTQGAQNVNLRLGNTCSHQQAVT